MAFVEAHWRCDFCDCVVDKSDLKAVPVKAVCLYANYCSECRYELGLTDEKLERLHKKLCEMVGIVHKTQDE